MLVFASIDQTYAEGKQRLIERDALIPVDENNKHSVPLKVALS
jgi:hypothetical protein